MTALIPALGQPGSQGLVDPGVVTLQVAAAVADRHESGVNHDAVRVLDDQLAGPVQGSVNLGSQGPAESLRDRFDRVDRAPPFADTDPGLLDYFSRQTGDD